MSDPNHRAGALRGFSLVEVMFALGLCSFVLVALLGLVLAGLRQDRDSQESLAAMLAADRILEEYRAVAATTNKIPNFPLPSNLAVAAANDASSPLYLDSRGNRIGNPASAAFGMIYRLIPASQTPVASSRVHLYFFWPAAAPVALARGHYEVGTTIPLVAPAAN